MPNSSKLQFVKRAPPPPELPVYGRTPATDISFIGRTNYVAALEEKKFLFGIKRMDRKRHLYAVGKGGVGKSKFIELLIRQDIAQGHGLCLLDPYGDIVRSILDFIPASRIDDVLVLDPSDLARPLLWNPLTDVPPSFRHAFSQGIIELFERQFGSRWTPRVEHLFRVTLLALFEIPGATVRDVMRMLQDPLFRRDALPFLTDPMTRAFWETEYETWRGRYDVEAIIPLINRLGQLFAVPEMQGMLGESENRVDFAALIASRKIILVNLAKGSIGEENAAFLGTLVVLKLKQIGVARALLPERERKDFYLYLDEFHALATETFEQMLLEGAKYGYCFALVHQYVAQLPVRMQAAILGSVGTILVFRVSGEDAARLAPEMAPVFEAKDMLNLGLQEFYIKLTINGETYDPFSAEVLQVLPPVSPSSASQILDSSYRRYGKETGVVS
jgi:hypothetical protein